MFCNKIINMLRSLRMLYKYSETELKTVFNLFSLVPESLLFKNEILDKKKRRIIPMKLFFTFQKWLWETLSGRKISCPRTKFPI